MPEILFDEILLDPGLFTIGDAVGSPEFANTMLRNPQTGSMQVGIVRYDPQHLWSMDFKMVTPSEGGSSENEMDYFNAMWYGGFGSGYGFRVRIETDHLAEDEVLGVSDGTIASRTWKLTKTYNRPGTTTHPYIRYICKPVAIDHLSVDSVTLYEPNGSDARVPEVPFEIMLDGVPTGAYTVSNTKGIVVLTATPAAGVVVSSSYHFDTPMRFFTNSFQQHADFPAQIKGLTLIEILPFELGLS